MAIASMSMNKVIHCAVRRDLGRFRAALGAFRDGDRERAAALHRAWVHFDHQLTEHHEGEHEVAWPAMAEIGIDRSVLDALDVEHDQMAADLATARAAMEVLARSASRADAESAAQAMTTLEVTTTTHLDHEESVTEPACAEHHDDPAVQRLGKEMRGRQSLPQAGGFLAWLQDGAGPAESAALRATVPGPVLAVLTTVLGRRYRREVASVWQA